MASGTASNKLGGQTQNLNNIIDLVSWEAKLKHCFNLRNYSNNLMEFLKDAGIKLENNFEQEKLFKS